MLYSVQMEVLVKDPYNPESDMEIANQQYYAVEASTTEKALAFARKELVGEVMGVNALCQFKAVYKAD